MNFIFIFISSFDPNLLRKKIGKTEEKKRWPYQCTVNDGQNFNVFNISKSAFASDHCLCDDGDDDFTVGPLHSSPRRSRGLNTFGTAKKEAVVYRLSRCPLW